MHPSTPFKIENGSPPRRITLDELVAFSKGFGRTLDDLLMPPEVELQELQGLAARYAEVVANDDERAKATELPRIVGELSARLGGVVESSKFLLEETERRFAPRGQTNSGSPQGTIQ